METRANYITVGVFVVGLCSVFILVLLWFTAGQHHEKYITYLVYMKEAVSGLNKQADVRFNGVPVGYVSDIKLDPKNPQRVELFLDISPETPINQSTVATLMSQGITGITYVGLKATAPKAPPIKILPGEEYPIIRAEPSLLTQLDTVLREVSTDFKKISKAVQELLAEPNQQAVRTILTNMKTLTDTIAKNGPEIDQGIKSAAKTFKSSEDLTQTLSQQAAPEAVDSLRKLSRVLSEVEQIADSIKQNPSVLIRGSAPAAKGPGE